MILIPVEIKSRELESRILMAIELQKLGHKAIIGRKAEIQKIALLLKNYIYIGLTYQRGMRNFYEIVKSRNSKLVLIDEEGLITGGIPYYPNLKCDKKNFEIADLIITWG